MIVSVYINFACNYCFVDDDDDCFE